MDIQYYSGHGLRQLPLLSQNVTMTHLRQIALTVDEQEPGHFYWLLIESKDDGWMYGELKACPEAFGTYLEALEAGMQELRRMVNWLDGLRE